MVFGDVSVMVYRIFSGSVNDVKTMTDETIDVHDVSEALAAEGHVIPNLRWLIPLALDKEIRSSTIINVS